MFSDLFIADFNDFESRSIIFYIFYKIYALNTDYMTTVILHTVLNIFFKNCSFS